MALFTGSSWVRDEEERAFLQRRVALYAKVLFFISLGADLFNLATSGVVRLLAAGAHVDHLITVMFAVLWLLCARGTRSVRFLRSAEAIGLAAISLAIAILGRYLAAGFLPAMAAGLEPAEFSSPALVRAERTK